MSNQALKSKRNLKIHDYDKRIKQTINLLQNDWFEIIFWENKNWIIFLESLAV